MACPYDLTKYFQAMLQMPRHKKVCTMQVEVSKLRKWCRKVMAAAKDMWKFYKV